MNTENSQKVKNQFKSLPKNVQEKFLSLDLTAELAKIPDAEPLQEKQKIAIENEIAGVFLGFSDLQEFTTVIKHQAEIARERAENISKALMINLFTPNAHILEQIYGTVKKESSGVPKKVTDGVVQANVPQKASAPESRDESGRLQNVEQKIKKEQTDSLDVFKKRLTAPVHTPLKEEQIGNPDNKDAQRISNINPSSKTEVAEDPYKETIE